MCAGQVEREAEKQEHLVERFVGMMGMNKLRKSAVMQWLLGVLEVRIHIHKQENVLLIVTVCLDALKMPQCGFALEICH